VFVAGYGESVKRVGTEAIGAHRVQSGAAIVEVPSNEIFFADETFSIARVFGEISLVVVLMLTVIPVISLKISTSSLVAPSGYLVHPRP
jgi:hypothetical protein